MLLADASRDCRSVGHCAWPRNARTLSLLPANAATLSAAHGSGHSGTSRATRSSMSLHRSWAAASHARRSQFARVATHRDAASCANTASAAATCPSRRTTQAASGCHPPQTCSSASQIRGQRGLSVQPCSSTPAAWMEPPHHNARRTRGQYARRCRAARPLPTTARLRWLRINRPMRRHRSGSTRLNQSRQSRRPARAAGRQARTLRGTRWARSHAYVSACCARTASE